MSAFSKLKRSIQSLFGKTPTEEVPAVMRPRAIGAILNGLGYDPKTHAIARRMHPKPGLVVLDKSMRPVQFVSAKALRKLGNDSLFMSGYAAHMEAE